MQDSKGFVWFCTNQGVWRYDGYQFLNFNITDNLPDNTVFEAFEDYKGRIWFTSLSEKLFYYYNDEFHTYAFNDTIEKYRMSNLRKVAKSTFFVDSLDNVYYTRYTEKPVVIDKSGHAKWFGFSDSCRAIITINKEGNLFNNYTKSDMAPYLKDADNRFIKLDIPINFYTSLFSHSVATKEFLVITREKEICVINRENGSRKTYEFENKIIWLSLDYSNVLWVGMFHNGVKGFKNMDLDNPSFHLLNNQSVSSICKDSEGGYWATTLDNGAFYFPSLQVQVLTKSNEMKIKSISAVCSNNKEIWFAGNLPYVYSLNGKLNELNEWPLKAGGYQDINRLFWQDKQLFISIFNPKARSIIFSPGKGVIKNLNFHFYNATNISNDTIIFCSSKQYWKYYKYNYTRKVLPDSILARNIYDICLDSIGNMWYATDHGLIVKKNHKFYEMADSNALYGNGITCIVGNNSGLWLGTKGAGLIHKTKTSLINYTTEEGLPSNSISDLIIQNDTVWFATNKGVSRFINYPTTSTIETWSTANGLANNEVNDIDILDGTVYVATQDGLCFFHQSMCGINKTPPPIYMNKIEINNKGTILQKDYKLNYKQNYINFSFIGISYQHNKRIEYKYRLEGIDKNWNYSSQTEARYSALPPGKYTFQVAAISNSGIISNKPVSINIYIRAPYWQTKWFLILISLIVSVLIALITILIFQNRIRVLKKQNYLILELNKFRQKALSAQMNPHFLYNSINSAQYYILNNQPNTASDYLSNLGSLMRVVLNNSLCEKISLKNELKALYLYVDMEQKRYNNSFKFCKNIDGEIDLDKIEVPPLILQPYVENAINHGLRTKQGDQLLKLNITKEQDFIIIEIEDNGVGRVQAGSFKLSANNPIKHVSLGTEITKRRLQIIEEIHSKKMSVEIKDLYSNEQIPNGTKVIVTIKQGTKL